MYKIKINIKITGPSPITLHTLFLVSKAEATIHGTAPNKVLLRPNTIIIY